jgi:hypothetical protein
LRLCLSASLADTEPSISLVSNEVCKSRIFVGYLKQPF